MDDMILLKLGELVLKGLNRRNFEDKLVANAQRRLKPLGSFGCTPSSPPCTWSPRGRAATWTQPGRP